MPRRAACCKLHATIRTEINKVYAGRNGIIGALTEDLIDTSIESDAAIAALKHTPGAAFGSCRYKLASVSEHRAQYERLIEVFQAHDIGFFFYNGGGDSQDTAYKVSQIGAVLDYPIVCVGIPKTIDNDLPITDCSPGFGSAAKYLATCIPRGHVRSVVGESHLDEGVRLGSDGSARWLDDRCLRARH
jgi:ATP-dependent phosphofructokinase / diphosphate-dependent phosphofructokinase